MHDTPQQALPIEFGNSVAFHCALHGTVTRCPWRWMDCTLDETPDDWRTSFGGKWHDQGLQDNATGESSNEQ